jgi:hypothetical protein
MLERPARTVAAAECEGRLTISIAVHVSGEEGERWIFANKIRTAWRAAGGLKCESGDNHRIIVEGLGSYMCTELCHVHTIRPIQERPRAWFMSHCAHHLRHVTRSSRPVSAPSSLSDESKRALKSPIIMQGKHRDLLALARSHPRVRGRRHVLSHPRQAPFIPVHCRPASDETSSILLCCWDTGVGRHGPTGPGFLSSSSAVAGNHALLLARGGINWTGPGAIAPLVRLVPSAVFVFSSFFLIGSRTSIFLLAASTTTS